MSSNHTSDNPEPESDDLLPEYHFDYTKAKPNRFAPQTVRVVKLDTDVSAVFTNAEQVNSVLRALISTMPPVKPAA